MKINIKLISENIYILQLCDHKKILTESSLHLSHDMLYRYGSEYLADILDKVCNIYTINNFVKTDKIVYDFAYQFWINSLDIQKVKDFINLITRENWETEYGENAISYYDQKSNKDTEYTIKRLYWIYFDLQHFVNKQWYYNAQTQLIDLKSDYQIISQDIYIDKLYFGDLYSIDHYRTSYQYLMTKSKAYQTVSLVDKLYTHIFGDRFMDFVKEKQIDTICMIPNNVRRAQNLNEMILSNIQNILPDLKYIYINKNESEKNLPQKSIKWIENRVVNADRLFDVNLNSIRDNQNILLIDDVFWSGATMNTISRKIKYILSKASIIWFAMLGSYRKWFDVINEI